MAIDAVIRADTGPSGPGRQGLASEETENARLFCVFTAGYMHIYKMDILAQRGRVWGQWQRGWGLEFRTTAKSSWCPLWVAGMVPVVAVRSDQDSVTPWAGLERGRKISPGRMLQNLVLGISFIQLRCLLLIPLLSKKKAPYVVSATLF